MSVTWSIVDNTDRLGPSGTTSSVSSVPLGTSTVDRYVAVFCTTLNGSAYITGVTIAGITATIYGTNNTNLPTIAVAMIPAGTSSGTVVATHNVTDQFFIYSVIAINGAASIVDSATVEGNNSIAIDAVADGLVLSTVMAWQNGANTWSGATEIVPWRSSTACAISVYNGSAQTNRSITYPGSNGITGITFAPQLPSFRSSTSTSYASGRTTTTLTNPGDIVANDIILVGLFCGKTNGITSAPTPPTGFNLIDSTSVQDPGFFVGKLYAYWKRAGTESGNYSFTHDDCYSQAVLMTYSGCVTSGSPIDVYSKNSGDGSAASFPSITTTATNTKLVHLAHDWEASSTLTPPTGFEERLDSLIYASDKNKVGAGATGTVTQTNANGTQGVWGGFLIALKADSSGSSEITGTFSQTLGNATTSSTTTVLITSSLSKTLDGVSLQAISNVLVSPSLSGTLDNVSVSATGVASIDSTLAKALDDVNVGTTGTVSIDSNLSTTLDNANVGTTGTVSIDSNLSTTLDNATVTITGIVPVGATFAATLENAVANSGVVVDITALESSVLDGAVMSSAGTVSITASASMPLDSASLSGNSTVSVTGQASVVLDGVVLNAKAVTNVVEIRIETPAMAILIGF